MKTPIFNNIKQSLKVNTLFTAIILLALAALLLVNIIALLLVSRYNLQLDLTSGAVYKISDETAALLQNLDKPVDIYVLSDEGGFSGSRYLDQAKRIIDRYPQYSSQITLMYIDYASNPVFAAGYPDLALSHGDIIVESVGNTRHVPAVNLFRYTYTQDGELAIMASRAEEAITSAVMSVISIDNAKIAMLTGNGAVTSAQLNSMLIDNNYIVDTVSLTAARLDEYDMAMLLLPSIDLAENEVRMLEEFLYNGGQYGKTLFYSAGVEQSAMPNLDRFLSEWGVRFSDGAVFETKPDNTYQFQPFYPLAQSTQNNYFNMLRDTSMPFLMPLSRPMEMLFTARDGYFVEEILYFSETSGVRPADAGETFSAEDSPISGPIPALVQSSYNVQGSSGELIQSHVIISASTGIFDTIALQNTSVTNAEYILNIIGGVTGRDDIINIQPKSMQGMTLGITSSEASVLGVFLVGIIPLAILLTGVGVWLYRRYK